MSYAKNVYHIFKRFSYIKTVVEYSIKIYFEQIWGFLSLFFFSYIKLLVFL